MTKSSVLRFSKYGVFQEGAYIGEKLEKNGLFLERGSQLQMAKKPANAGITTAMPSEAYESLFVVNGEQTWMNLETNFREFV